MKALTIQCSRCKGRGEVELNGEFAETLLLLRKQKEELNGASLAKLAGIHPTAMNNRLVWLERNGFATGRRYGRSRFWRAK